MRSGVLGSPSLSHEQNTMGSLGLQRLLRQAVPVFAQVTPHRDHVMSFSFRPPFRGDGLQLTQSPKGGPLHGFWASGCGSQRTVSLGCQPGEVREPLETSRIITCLISYDLSQAGSLSRIRERWRCKSSRPLLCTPFLWTSLRKFKTSPLVSAHPR